jgi:hypothetical protein
LRALLLSLGAGIIHLLAVFLDVTRLHAILLHGRHAVAGGVIVNRKQLPLTALTTKIDKIGANRRAHCVAQHPYALRIGGPADADKADRCGVKACCCAGMGIIKHGQCCLPLHFARAALPEDVVVGPEQGPDVGGRAFPHRPPIVAHSGDGRFSRLGDLLWRKRHAHFAGVELALRIPVSRHFADPGLREGRMGGNQDERKDGTRRAATDTAVPDTSLPDTSVRKTLMIVH